MALACATPDASTSLVQGLAAYLECHAGSLSEGGYRALAGSSLLEMLLTGCLTIFVALFGYRLLLAQDVDLRDLIIAAARVGVVITFALRWDVYQTVINRVAVEGPVELAGIILQPQGLKVLSSSDLAARFESAYETLERSPGALVNSNPVPLTTAATPAPPSTQPVASSSGPALTAGGVALVICTLGPLAAVHIAAAVLLTLGPVLIILALFDPFLGILEGWLRALATTVLASCVLSVILALELNFLESEVAGNDIAVLAHADQDILAVAFIFGIVAIAAVLAANVAANGFLIPRRRYNRAFESLRSGPAIYPPAFFTSRGMRNEAPPAPSRAQAVADAVLMRSRREQAHLATERGEARSVGSSILTARAQPTDATPFRPIGSSFRGPGSSRRALSIARRNRR